MTSDQRQKNAEIPMAPLLGALLGIIFLLAVYVASFGPAHSLVMRGYIEPEFVMAFYAPVPRSVASCSLQWWRTHVDSYGAGVMFHR